MPLNYYSLPLDPSLLMQQKEHPVCALKQSVAGHLHLIVTTAFGEMQGDSEYGNAIWEHDFDNLTTRARQQEMIKESLTRAVKAHEQRLIHVKVEVTVRQEELSMQSDSKRIKKRLDLFITGKLTATSEEIVFRDSFFVSPLSYS